MLNLLTCTLLQPIGLVILIIGVFVYNDIIIMPLIRSAE